MSRTICSLTWPDGSFDFRIVSCSTGVKSLLLIKWSESPESTWNSLSFEVVRRGEETFALGTQSEELVLTLSIWTWKFAHILVWKSKLMSLPLHPCTMSTRWIFFLTECWSVWIFADFRILSGWLHPIFPCRKMKTCLRHLGVSLGIGSCHPTESLVTVSGADPLLWCRLQLVLTFCVHQQV